MYAPSKTEIHWVNDLGERLKSQVYADFIDQWGKRWYVVRYWRTSDPWLVEDSQLVD